MNLTRLQLIQVRGFEQAEFKFNPGINLLVGINGVGKSTVLDVLRIMLRQVLPRVSAAHAKTRSFTKSFSDQDIRVGHNSLTAILDFPVNQVYITYAVQRLHLDADKSKEYPQIVLRPTAAFPSIADQIAALSSARTLAQLTGEDIQRDLVRQIHANTNPLLAIYFSPHRSFFRTRQRTDSTTNPLDSRELSLVEFAQWWRGRQQLAEEGLATARQQLDALNATVHTFLNSCGNIRAVAEPEPTLLIDKDRTTLDVRQLSDGERGVLALALDLSRRLALAYPEMPDPNREGSAVVLIDELDLHLHPIWQRSVVQNLRTTFPNCQFIATTHSPEIISEVEPDHLQFLVKENNRVYVRPARQAYGLDVNWIVKHLMGGRDRPEPAQRLLDTIEDAIEEGDLELARTRLEELRRMLHGADGEVTRLEASINTLEALADAVHTEEAGTEETPDLEDEQPE
jgi:predicted ATP-binding protein involved in virulence